MPLWHEGYFELKALEKTANAERLSLNSPYLFKTDPPKETQLS